MTIVRLLHGLGADRRAFQRFERLLPPAWDIRSLDLLGHGEAPQPDSGYSLEHHADHVAEVVAAEAPVVLVGHSYGAATAVAVAARRPHLVSGIILLDPIVANSPARDGTGTRQMIDARRGGRLREQVESMYADASPALRAWIVDTWTRMADGVIVELDLDWTRFAAQVTCPVGIVHGELARGGGGDLAADWFDEPQVHEVRGAGHYLHASHARETAAAVVDVATRLSLA